MTFRTSLTAVTSLELTANGVWDEAARTISAWEYDTPDHSAAVRNTADAVLVNLFMLISFLSFTQMIPG